MVEGKRLPYDAIGEKTKIQNAKSLTPDQGRLLHLLLLCKLTTGEMT